MSCFRFCPHCWMRRVEQTLHRLEIKMSKLSDQLDATNSKIDAITFAFTDYVNDVRELITLAQAEDRLSPSTQAKLDDLTRKTDAHAVALANADVELGDRDGSDVPTEPSPEQPAAAKTER